KGGLALYALSDYIGNENTVRALKAFYNEFSNTNKDSAKTAPNSLDLIRHLRAVTPAAYQQLVTDLFESIILYEFAATEATVQAMPDGKFKVRVSVTTNKLVSDGKGRETEQVLQIPIAIGLFGARDPVTGIRKPIHREKYQIAGQGSIEVVVDEKPVLAGINPYHILLERDKSDNYVYVVKH
ncbi:MAG: hypothetical protein HRT35_32380, partial [Algicola sp.]|nr:hypothetical protein [Algicola sp.]